MKTRISNAPALPHVPARAEACERPISARALSTPEPLVRHFSRRVQQEGALDLTQGDYKNADFAPHPEVVRAAQRITRNTVHSYGPAIGRMDVRGEVAEFFNRDGLLDYPASDVRFLPDEVIFTPGTRSGLAMVLEVLGADGTGVVVPRPSWEYDWFIERAGKRVVELPTGAPAFLPDPDELEVLLARGGISAVIVNNPHNPTGRVYPRGLVEDLVRVAVAHRAYVLYDCVYQRLDYVGSFVNPAFADPDWRDWVVTLSGLSKMDMFGASTGARACWMVISDRIKQGDVRARDILANLSAWLVATPSTLAQDWALAALQSPLAALRRPSPYMRERRDFMARAADELAPLGIERTDFGGTFYAPLAFPGLVGEPFDRLRNGVHERAVVRDSVDAFEFLLSGGVGGIPFAAFSGTQTARCGTWQRLSYGSKDVKELAVFMDRVHARLTSQGRLGSGKWGREVLSQELQGPAADAAVWASVCTREGYSALDDLDPSVFAAARARILERPRDEHLRLTGTKHPDSTTHRAEQLARAIASVPAHGADRARRALTHLEWNPLVEARQEYEETIADLLGPCNEVLLDYEGRQISPDWLDVPEKVVLALLRHGIVPGEDRHLLFRVPNPFIEQDEEKVSRILATVARANLLFLLACRRLGIEPAQNAIYELTVPQINSRAELGAVVKAGTLYLQAVDGLFEGPADRLDAFLSLRIPEPERAELRARVAKVRLVPLCENVGALAHLPELLEAFYQALERGRVADGQPTPSGFTTRFDGTGTLVRVFVAMSDTAEQSGKVATDVAYTLAVAGRDEAERRLAERARRIGEPAPRVAYLVGAGRAGFRGGFDPEHPGVIRQFARADGVTIQGIRADAPAETDRLAHAYRAAAATGIQTPAVGPSEREALLKLLEAGVKTHTETLLRVAPLLAPFGGLVPQTRVRIRATGSVSYGRSIPDYPEEWGGGSVLPDIRDLRDAWPEGVTLPRAIVYNLGSTTLGLPAVTSDLACLDRRAALLLDRHVPGYREIIASELPCFVRESVALVFGRKLADATAKRCLRAAAALWVDVRAHADLAEPTCLFAMLYLRYLAEDSESWDETKEHESLTTREEELIRETSNGAFGALCAERPGDRWNVLQALVDAEEASRLLLARELTIEEKREFVDLRIEGWLRTLPDGLSQGLRREWSRLRELSKDELTLAAIERLVALETLRGSRGA